MFVLIIIVQHVNLPERAIGVMDLEFRLPGVAALDTFFAQRADAGGFKPWLDLHQQSGVGQAQTDVIQRASGSRLPRNQ